MSADKRRSGLPRSLAGRKFKYDRRTTVVPVEITPRSPHWTSMRASAARAKARTRSHAAIPMRRTCRSRHGNRAAARAAR